MDRTFICIKGVRQQRKVLSSVGSCFSTRSQLVALLPCCRCRLRLLKNFHGPAPPFPIILERLFVCPLIVFNFSSYSHFEVFSFPPNYFPFPSSSFSPSHSPSTSSPSPSHWSFSQPFASTLPLSPLPRVNCLLRLLSDLTSLCFYLSSVLPKP